MAVPLFLRKTLIFMSKSYALDAYNNGNEMT
jgi:hypothetical protein